MSSVLTAPKQDDGSATGNASLLERMIAAWSRSFELLAESKARFPIDM